MMWPVCRINRNVARRLAAFVALLSVLCVGNLCAAVSDKKEDPEYTVSADDLYQQIEIFSDVLTLIKSEYVDTLDARDLIYGALRGMLSSLDPYSQFLDPDEYKDLKTDTKGKFGGLGIEVTIDAGFITVITPLADSPADRAGLKPQDKIIKIDGVSTKGMSLSEAVKKMRGEPGTAVKVVVFREKTSETLTLDIERAVIRVESIKNVQIISDGIGYVRIAEFQQDTTNELVRALKRLQSEKMSSLIIDLRNNPGGLLDAAIGAADLFLPADKLIVYTKSRVESQTIEFKSKHKEIVDVKVPIVCIINRGSASAAEILAGTLQDHKRAIILGVQSFKKGSVQVVVPMRDSSAIKITTAAYYTPSGKMIRDTGIIPDVHLEYIASPKKSKKTDKRLPPDKKTPDEESESPKNKLLDDNQIRSAYNMLKGIDIYNKQSEHDD